MNDKEKEIRRKEYMKKYYAENKEKLNAYSNEWRLKNLERVRVRCLKWYHDNKHKMTAEQKEAKNQWCRRWIEKNREAHNARRREKRKEMKAGKA